MGNFDMGGGDEEPDYEAELAEYDQVKGTNPPK